MTEDSIFVAVHQTAEDLRSAGAISQDRMADFDRLCLPNIKAYSAEDIRGIRKRNDVSQTTFARFFNVSKSTVQKWEQGINDPQGASLKLLNLVDSYGLDYIAK